MWLKRASLSSVVYVSTCCQKFYRCARSCTRHRFVAQLFADQPDSQPTVQRVTEFLGLVRQRRPNQFAEWLGAAERDTAPETRGLAVSLPRTKQP